MKNKMIKDLVMAIIALAFMAVILFFIANAMEIKSFTFLILGMVVATISRAIIRKIRA